MAGLMSALHLAAFGKVVVVTKGRLADCNTNFAQGGICCVMDPADTFDRHARDTMIAGAWLGKSAVVHEICEHAPEGIQDLIDCGVKFAKKPGGGWDLTRVIPSCAVTGQAAGTAAAMQAASGSVPEIGTLQDRLRADGVRLDPSLFTRTLKGE